jgi:tetratricopeptide (TPR) repeat protein
MLEERHVEADYVPLVAEGAPASVYVRVRDVSVLPGYMPRFSQPFAEWLESFRGEVASRVRRGLVRAIADARARGRYSLVEELARRCLAIDPLNEEATLALAEATALGGNKLEAVRMIERYMEEIGSTQRELRLAPSLLRRRVSEVLVARERERIPVELPLIGRENDVERVMLAMGSTHESGIIAYTLAGESGIGKTRLAVHCCRIAQLHGAQVVQLGAVPANRRQPLAVLCQLVSELLELPGSLGCAPAALECLRSLLGSGGDSDEEGRTATDAESSLAVLRWSVIDLFDAIAGEAPLVVFLDDVQYADDASIRLLRDVVHAFVGKRLFVLLCLRTDLPESREAPLVDILSVAKRHHVHPLTVEARRALVRAFADAAGDSLGEEAVERAVELSGGNPFFLVEILKHLFEHRDLPGLPLTLQSLVEQRLTRLSEGALQCLQVTALLGRRATPSRLRRLLRIRAPELVERVGELERAGIVSLLDDAVVCDHEIMCSAALTMLTESQLRLWHRRVAALLTRELLSSQAVADLWACMEHWQRAGRPELALRLALLVARRLTRAGLASESQEVLSGVKQFCTTPEQRARWLREVIALAAAQRQWGEVLARAKEYKEVAQRLPQPQPIHTDTELHECNALFRGDTSLGHLDAQISLCVSAHDAAPRHRLEAAMLILTKADNEGDEATARHIIQLLQGIHTTPRTSILAQKCQLIFHTTFGDGRTALGIADELVRYAATTRDILASIRCLRYAALTHNILGNREYARTLVLEAYHIAHRLKLTAHEVLCIEHLAAISMDICDYSSAQRWITQLRPYAYDGAGLYPKAVLHLLENRLAFELGDGSVVTAKHLRPMLLSILPQIGISRSRQGTLSALVAESLVVLKSTPSPGQLSELHQLHQSLRKYNRQDFPVSVLATAYLHLGDFERARSLVRQYIPARREPPASLRDATPLRRIAHQLQIELG